jgi:hypothetical protein
MSYKDTIDGGKLNRMVRRGQIRKRAGRSGSKTDVNNGRLTCEVKVVGALRMRAIWKPKTTEKGFDNEDSLSAAR